MKPKFWIGTSQLIAIAQQDQFLTSKSRDPQSRKLITVTSAFGYLNYFSLEAHKVLLSQAEAAEADAGHSRVQTDKTVAALRAEAEELRQQLECYGQNSADSFNVSKISGDLAEMRDEKVKHFTCDIFVSWEWENESHCLKTRNI